MLKVKSLFKMIFNKKIHFEKTEPEANDYPILLITYDFKLKKEHIFEAENMTTKYLLEQNIKNQNAIRKASKNNKTEIEAETETKNKQTIEITGWLHKLY
jgi:hypothetical protein